QEKPSARSRVWVVVVAAMIVPSRGGMASFFLVKKVIPDYGTLAEVSLTSVKATRGLLLRHLGGHRPGTREVVDQRPIWSRACAHLLSPRPTVRSRTACGWCRSSRACRAVSRA